MEARALTQFSPPDGPLCKLGQSNSITVPGLLYHSPEEHVLVFEDLGRLITLYEYFSTFQDEKVDDPKLVREACRKLGSRIGEFFAQLHSPSSLELIRTAISGNDEKPLSKDLVLQAAVMPLKEYLARYNIPDTQKLFSRVLAEYQREKMPVEQCFTLGDFTPGAILLASAGDGSQSMGVIDWEFSGIGRGPNGDMPQLLAVLHLLLIAASPGSQRHCAIYSFIQGVCAAYHRHASTWLQQLYLRLPNSSDALKPQLQTRAENLRIFRSALILHGREMINNAIEQEWHDSTSRERGVLVQEMVQKGAWYLEMAGDDIEDMLDAMNVVELLKEDSRVILNLFGVDY